MTPVLVRGVLYPSVAETCRRLKVAEKTVNRNLDAGTPDLIGLVKHRRHRPYTENGVTYPTMFAAAKALGVTGEAIRQRANRAEKNKSEREGK